MTVHRRQTKGLSPLPWKLYVSFAKEPYKIEDILQKRWRYRQTLPLSVSQTLPLAVSQTLSWSVSPFVCLPCPDIHENVSAIQRLREREKERERYIYVSKLTPKAYSCTSEQEIEWEVGGWGRDPFSRNFMKPTPRRKWYLTTGRRFH